MYKWKTFDGKRGSTKVGHDQNVRNKAVAHFILYVPWDDLGAEAEAERPTFYLQRIEGVNFVASLECSQVL